MLLGMDDLTSYVTHLLWGDNFNQLQNVDPLGQQPLPLASVGKHTSDRSTASWAVEESRCRRVCADVVQDPSERWQTVQWRVCRRVRGRDTLYVGDCVEPTPSHEKRTAKRNSSRGDGA